MFLSICCSTDVLVVMKTHLVFLHHLFPEAPVKAVSRAQLWPLASSLLNDCCSACWRPDDWEVWESVGWCSEVWLMMIGVNTVARQLAHLLASHCRGPLGEESGLSSTGVAARLDAHEEFNMVFRCRLNVPESWICGLEYTLYIGIRYICIDSTLHSYWFILPPNLLLMCYYLYIHMQQNKNKNKMTSHAVTHVGKWGTYEKLSGPVERL